MFTLYFNLLTCVVVLLCLGTGPHTAVGWRFDGLKHRDPSFYEHERESDKEMLERHFLGWQWNSTLRGLHDLKVIM